MAPPDWQQIRAAFDAALDLPAGERVAFLQAHYSPDVAAKAADLLGHHDAATAFLDPAPRTLMEGGLAEAAQAPLEREDLRGQVIAGRYELGGRLGEGGTATVYEAADRVSGETVAVKVGERRLGAPVDLIRHEALALRLLRLPGVVEMRDSGRDGERSFLVMRRVDGRPFPGLETPAPVAWDLLRERTFALLEVLARIHATGTAHCDLKPSNVLVDADGNPVVLDLGIAQDPGGDDALRRMLAFAGTPRYRAPEQLRGQPGTAASDLFAVGVMLYEALAGEDPHHARDAAELLSLRPHVAAQPLGDRAPDVPPAVAAVVDALVAVDPADRPASAADALAALHAASEGTLPRDELGQRIDALPGATLDATALASLFAGYERIHRIPSDAADALLERTGGARTAVRRELAAWQRAGLARVEGGAVHIARTALDRLRGGLMVGAPAASGDGPKDAVEHARRAEALPADDPLRLYHRLMAGDLRAACAEAVTIGDALFNAGRIGEAFAVLSDGVAALRAHDEPVDEGPLFGLLLRVAMQTGTTRALDAVLYALGRTSTQFALRPLLEGIARGAQLALQSDNARALEALPPIDERLDAEAARAAVVVRMFVARHLDADERQAQIDQMLPIATARNDDVMLRSIGSEQAWDAYTRGAYEEATEKHRRLAAKARSTASRQTSLLNAASAALEVGAFDDAVAMAEEARELAAEGRNVISTARAERTVRAAAYRRGDDLAPDHDLVEAVAAVGIPSIEALMALNEAAFAWRGGRLPEARTLATRAAAIWGRRQQHEGAWLSEALALASGAEADDETFARLADDLDGCEDDDIVAQAAHLAASRPSPSQARLRALARERAMRVPSAMHEACREVLPISDILK